MSRTGRPVLALMPSDGLGGGIEALAMAIVEQLRSRVPLETISLLDARHPSLSATRRIQFICQVALRSLRGRSSSQQVVTFHPSMIPAAFLAQLLGRDAPPTVVILYGIDIWHVRWWQLRLLRLRRARLVTISDFSAGAIAGRIGRAAEVLPVTLDRERFSVMTRISRMRTSEDLRRPAILTVFRLSEAAGKGAYQLITAAEFARRRFPELILTIAGHGPISAALSSAVDRRHWIRLVESPSFVELSKLYEGASLFVLATRTRPWDGSVPSGEGFGVVLAEAQLAGLPVIAPASGGSSSAYLEGETGLRPVDESAESLARCMVSVLSDATSYHQLSRRALEWAPRVFEPGRLGEWLGSIFDLNGGGYVCRHSAPDVEGLVVPK